MSLAEEIRRLRDRALEDLASAHDYYTDTKSAWRIVRKFLQSGGRFKSRNNTTGTVTTEFELAGKSRGYMAEQLAQATFQQFVSIFEHNLFDLLRLWLVAFPQSLGAKELPFRIVLDAPDLESVTLYMVNKELNAIAYERPKDWFNYLEAKLKLGCPTEDEIDRIGELKASRDILAHNHGIANKTYLLKSGRFARANDGQRLDIPEEYHRESWELIRKVLVDVFSAAAVKVA